jgi:hypothetical protein
MIALLSLILSVVVFCVFIGIFIRLGRIELILRAMAVHQGAIEKGKGIRRDFLGREY